MAELSTYARPYANAMFKLAEQRGELSRWSAMLGLLAGLAAEEKVARRLENPTLTDEQQAALLNDLAGDELDDRARALVRLMARNDRLAALPAVHDEFEALRAESEKTLDVEVSTAFPLDDDQRELIAARLRARFGREVNIATVEDRALIGGFFVRAGDTVIDASVRGRLARLHEQLMAQ